MHDPREWTPTQIDIKYAESVVRRVINEPFRSLAPTFGVDVSVVAKWVAP
jgi:hypothetical protein